MLRQVSEKDLKISPIKFSDWHAGYAIGDLLWAPVFRAPARDVGGEVDTGSNRYRRWEAKRHLIGERLPDSVVGRYCALHEAGDRCPRGDRLRECLAGYGDSIHDPYLRSVIAEVEKETTLCVHMRCGDQGPGPMQAAIERIDTLLGRFESVIVLTGFHAIYDYYEDKKRAEMMKQSLVYLRQALQFSPKVRICLDGSADDHMYILCRARHLLLSSGGFTELAGISAEGHVYVPRDFGARWEAELHENVTLEHVGGKKKRFRWFRKKKLFRWFRKKKLFRWFR